MWLSCPHHTIFDYFSTIFILDCLIRSTWFPNTAGFQVSALLNVWLYLQPATGQSITSWSMQLNRKWYLPWELLETKLKLKLGHSWGEKTNTNNSPSLVFVMFMISCWFYSSPPSGFLVFNHSGHSSFLSSCFKVCCLLLCLAFPVLFC